jgi:2-(1,2-epoxy-1,2-dihydrophenyl)acetyl-CoA isomerase
VIATESRERVCIVRLDRPEQRNAMVPSMLEALTSALTEVQPTATRAVVVTGSGPAFCVGADLNWLASLPDPADGVAELVSRHHRAILAMADLPVPLIAAVNGSAAGGGISFALAADYCMAADSASFTAAYFRLGLTPDGGSTVLLPRAIGAARTRELLLTNRRLRAADALQWGLVNEVVPPAELVDRAVAFASSLDPVPPETLRRTRTLLGRDALAQQLDLEAVAIRSAAHGQTFQQAIARFRAAHPPR